MTESTESNRPIRKRVAPESFDSSSIYIEDRTETPAPVRPFWRGLGRLLFRLLLLGVGGSLAAIAGVLLAIAYPQPNSNTPLVVRVWNLLQAKSQEINKNLAKTSDSPEALPSVSLAREEKQQLQNQLNSLKREYNSLRDRAREVENRLSLKSSDSDLPERLEAIDQTLRQATTLVGGTAISLENNTSATNQVKVTLPADVLFTPQNTLSKDAGLILDTVLTDLRRYPGSTLRIAVHSDATQNPQESQERSFRQAGILKEYLQGRLGDNYRWVTVGYGQSRPLVANDTETNRQRNRRVEISID